MDNETKIAVSFNNTVKNLDQVTKYERELQKVYGYVSALKNPKATQALQEMDKTAKALSKEVKENQKETKKIGDILGTAFNIKVIEGFTKAITKLGKGMFSLAQKSSEYVENVNLLEVAYKNANETIEQSSKRIETYIDKMSEVYGLDESRLTRQFGIFKQLANAMQLPTETAENLSEIMVKMTNDIASLYNLDLNRASNALQSALAGQVRPIRSATGADITEKTLQTTVDALGLDRTINQLSYVEKRLVMVISLTNQLKASQGDYARTIESSANQIRVMHEQWDRLSRAVGNIFYPILQKVLPWINGILMALTEIFNLLASFLGFKMPEFDYSGLVGVSDLAQDIEDELGGAGEAVDNLANKLKGLRSFDKLNVINTPSSSSAGGVAGGGVGGIGDIDPKIMDAFNKAFGEYDDMMGKVQMKAEKIRDNIMEWLGFTKEINPLTGEISWKFDHITAGTVLGALAVGGAIYTGISKIAEMLTKITGLNFMPMVKAFGVIAGGIGGGELISLILGQEFQALENLSPTAYSWLEKIDVLHLTDYKDQDMFSMWKDIFTIKSNTKNYLSNNMSDEIDEILTKATKDKNLYNYLAGNMTDSEKKSYEENAPQEIKNLMNTIKAKYVLNEPQKQSYNWTDFVNPFKGIKKAGYNAGIDIGNWLFNTDSKWESEYADVIEDIRKQLDGYSLFSPVTEDDVVTLNNYTDAMTRYFDTISGKYSQTQNFIDVLSQSKDAFQSANDGLELLLTQMSAGSYEITAEDLSKINSYLYEMQTASNQASQAFFDAITSMIVRLQDQGYVSDQVAQKVIDNAYRKKLAEEGETQAYIEKALELQHQLENNEISTDEYYQKLLELHNEYKKAPSSMQKFKTHIDISSESLKLNAKSWEEVTTNLSTTKAKLKETTDAMKSDYETQMDLIEEAMAQTEKGSQEYWNLFLASEALTQEYTDNAKDMEDSYVNYLLTIMQNINDSYEEGSEEADRYMQAINDELSQYGVDVDLSKGKENIDKQIDDIQKGVKYKVDSMDFKFKIRAEADENQIKNTMANFAGGVFDVISSLPIFNKNASDRSWVLNKIYGTKFANGGLPQVGQLFIANERGPELVGQIGGQSFVANQTQMMDLLDKKIGNTQNQKQVFNIYLDDSHLLATYTLDQLQEQARTNGNAIRIG